MGKGRQTTVLSERDKTIMEYLAQGFTYNQIALKLGLSKFTVRDNIEFSIFAKLGAINGPNAVALYMEQK